MNVVAFDPGETTGWVQAKVTPQTDDGLCIVNIVNVGEINGIKDMDDQMFVPMLKAEYVIIEDYRIYPSKAAQHIGQVLYTAEEIGRITAYAYRLGGISEIIRQNASTAKQRFPDNRLEEYAGQFSSKHIADAVRHLLSWTERKYGFLEVT